MKSRKKELIVPSAIKDLLNTEVGNAGFSSPFYPKFVSSTELLKIAEKKVWRDYRAVHTETEQNGIKFATTFEGLDFDHERLRSQTFVLCDSQLVDFLISNAMGETKVITCRKDCFPTKKEMEGYTIEASHDSVVGILTLVIAPKAYIKNERYFRLLGNFLELVDFVEAHELEVSPDFLVIPAWAYVQEEYRTRFAIPAYRAYTKMLKALEENAPENTYIELAAAGKIEGDERKLLLKLSEEPVGTKFSIEDFTFNVALLGENSMGSNSSVKLAQGLGLKRRKNVGSYKSLGPVFSKKLK